MSDGKLKEELPPGVILKRQLDRPIPEQRGKDTGTVFREAVDVVEVREPDFGDVADALNEDGDGNILRVLIARCTGLTDADVRGLKASDGMALAKVVRPFLS